MVIIWWMADMSFELGTRSKQSKLLKKFTFCSIINCSDSPRILVKLSRVSVMKSQSSWQMIVAVRFDFVTKAISPKA
jgi:hypothetical protein